MGFGFITPSSASKTIGRDVGTGLVGIGQAIDRAKGATNPAPAIQTRRPVPLVQSVTFSTLGAVAAGTSGAWLVPANATVTAVAATLGTGSVTATVHVGAASTSFTVTSAGALLSDGLALPVVANVDTITVEVTDAGTSTLLVVRVDWHV